MTQKRHKRGKGPARQAGGERANPPRPEQAARPRPDGELIVFRHLGDQVGPDCKPGWWWVVEAYDDRPFPVGQAWVMVVPQDLPARAKYVTTPQIYYVLVSDDSRRKGVATRLVLAIRERWPGGELTPPISKAGQALCDKLDGPLEPEDVYSPQAITRMRAEGMSRADIRKLARGLWEGVNPLFESSPAQSPKPTGRRRARRTGDTKS